MRKIKLTILLLATIFILSACTSEETETAEGKTIIRAYLGGGSVTDAIERTVNIFNEQSTDTSVEVVPMPADTASMITVMFNSGNTPTVLSLETGDMLRASDRLADLSDMEAIQYAMPGTVDAAVDENGKVNGLPYRIEGMGLIYNRKVLDETLGEDYDPNTIMGISDLEDVFIKIQDKGITPVILGAQDWSLSSHLTNDIYMGQSPDPKEQAEFVEGLKSGDVDLASNDIFNKTMDTVDLLAKYNYYGDNPLMFANDGDTSKQGKVLADGDVAFWFQGNWGSQVLDVLDPDGDFGMIPLPIGDVDEYPNNKIATLVPSYLSIYNGATEEQIESGKELIDFLLQSETGWDFVINDAKGLPAYSNSTVEVTNTIAKDIQNYMNSGDSKVAYMANTADHYVDTGASLQRYLDGQIDREQVAKDFESYWSAK